MEHHSILGPSPAELEGPAAAAALTMPAPSPEAREVLRFPGEDGGQSLLEMAERDLEAALRLLAERAQYITAASGSAIGLLKGGEMICRAAAGTSSLQVGICCDQASGLSVESVRSGQMLRCDDAQSDPRVNPQCCQALGIVSAMAMPLRQGENTVGVFELVSGKRQAFEEHDVAAMQRLGEMIQTALEHADAAKRSAQDIPAEMQVESAVTADSLFEDTPVEAESPREDQSLMGATEPSPSETETRVLRVERGNIGKCEKCGFPVSAGRSLCLDCEGPRAKLDVLSVPETELAADPPALFNLGQESQGGWLQSHKFLIGILVAALLAAAALLWFR